MCLTTKKLFQFSLNAHNFKNFKNGILDRQVRGGKGQLGRRWLVGVIDAIEEALVTEVQHQIQNTFK